MIIPIRAVYARAPRGAGDEWEPKMTGAVYADVPDKLILGTLAQSARNDALHAGDNEAVEIIDRAIVKACAAGKIMTMD